MSAYRVPCLIGDIKSAYKVLESGVDVNQAFDYYQTPLCLAVSCERWDISKMLIENGADVDQSGYQDKTPLWIAVHKGNIALSSLLIENGADINKTNISGWSPLFLACRRGDTKMVELLIANGAEVNLPNRWNVTPLDAIFYKYENIVNYLIRNGGNIPVKGTLFERLPREIFLYLCQFLVS